jgi:hypothetical protein
MYVTLLMQRVTHNGRLRRPWLRLRVILLSMLFLTPMHGSAAETADDLLRLADMLATAHHQTRAELIRGRYEALRRAARDQSPSDDLLGAFKAAEIAAFYSHDPAIALELRDIYVRLREHRVANATHAESVLGSLVQTRELQAAHAFNTEAMVVPGERLVRLAHAPTPGTDPPFVLDVAGAELVPRGVDVSTGLRLLVVAHPGCGYSRQAADAIEADDTLREIFEQKAVWIAPPTREPTNESTITWNLKRPRQRLSVAYRTSDWPMISDWSTPMFYILRDGRVVRTLTGWPKDGATQAELRALLQDASLRRP